MKYPRCSSFLYCVAVLTGQGVYAHDADNCKAYTIAPGTPATMPEDSFAYVSRGTKVFMLETHNTVNLNGNASQIAIRHGVVEISVPRNAKGPWDNLVTTCPGDM